MQLDFKVDKSVPGIPDPVNIELNEETLQTFHWLKSWLNSRASLWVEL